MLGLLKYRRMVVSLTFLVYDFKTYPINCYRVSSKKEPFLIPHRPCFHAGWPTIKTCLQCVYNMQTHLVSEYRIRTDLCRGRIAEVRCRMESLGVIDGAEGKVFETQGHACDSVILHNPTSFNGNYPACVKGRN